MKKLLIPLLIILLLFIYLNRSYAHIFAFIREKNLPRPRQASIELSGATSQTSTLTYIALGSSLTAGVGSSQMENTFPYIIAAKLNSPKRRVKLLNLGIPGGTTDTVLQYEIPQAIQAKPNLVTIEIGINDMHNLITLNQFRGNYNQILQTLAAQTSAKVVILNIPYLGSRSLILPPYNLLYDYRTRQLNEVIQTLADKYRLQVVDLYTLTKNLSNSSDFYSPDLFHPSDQGYREWGEFIASAVNF